MLHKLTNPYLANDLSSSDIAVDMPTFVLRVINPDEDTEDEDTVQKSKSSYSDTPPLPMTSPNITKEKVKKHTPEYSIHAKYTSPPPMIRRVSKVLVETTDNNYLPPLDLSPLLTTDETHLLIPPTLPPHQSDLIRPDILSSPKTTAAIAPESVNAMAISTDYLSKENVFHFNDNRKSDMTHQVRSDSVTPSTVISNYSQSTSKYTKASYSLTNHPDAIKLYRTMAVKTNDRHVQLAYAKYLLEVSSLYDSKEQPAFRPKLNLTLPALKKPYTPSIDSRRSSIDTSMSAHTFNLMKITSNDRRTSIGEEEEAVKRKKKKMLEEEGVRWIKKLSKKHVGEAAYLMGLWYAHGMYGFSKSTNKALKYYEMAATDNIPEAMFVVAQYHEKEQDYMTSFKLYEEAASLGLVEALYRIALIHLNGEFGSRRNINAAIQLLIKTSEKTTGTCPEAPYTLALILSNEYPGVNIPSELIQSYGGTFAAMTYLEIAADMGMSEALYRLGYIYEHGIYNVRVNIIKAFDYYETVVKNSDNTEGMLGLSRIYNQGVQVPLEEVEEQKRIFEQDESNWKKTRKRDEDSAFYWCHKAADNHSIEAYYLLGWYYEMGIGVPRDYKQAHYYYSKAYKRRHKKAGERIEALNITIRNQKDNKHTLNQKRHNRESQCNIM